MKRTMAVALLLARWLCGQSVPQVSIQQIEVRGHPGQSYALYVPSNYAADRAWPIVYCLDPGARGRVPVERFAAAAEKYGYVIAGSNNSRNGPVPPVLEAHEAMVVGTDLRFAIDVCRP